MLIKDGLWNWPRIQTRKKNRNCLDNTKDTSSEPSTPSFSYNRLNKNTDPNTTVVLPPHFDNYIQTQRNSASDGSEVANYILSSGLYKSTNHNGNMDGKDNDDSR